MIRTLAFVKDGGLVKVAVPEDIFKIKELKVEVGMEKSVQGFKFCLSCLLACYN